SDLLDAGDLDAGEVLAVTLPTTVPGLVLVLEDGDLLAALVTDDLGGHLHSGQILGARGHLLAVDEQHGSQLAGRPRRTLDAVHDDDVTDGHLLLSAAGLDDRVHHVAAHLCRTTCLDTRVGRRWPPGPRAYRGHRSGLITSAHAGAPTPNFTRERSY